jgi:hypothetical protein
MVVRIHPVGSSSRLRLAYLGLGVSSKGRPTALPQVGFLAYAGSIGCLAKVKPMLRPKGDFSDEVGYLYSSPVLDEEPLRFIPTLAPT